jgi:hypothetical protein
MKRFFAHQTGVARQSVVLGCILLMVTGGPLFAQTTGSVNPGPDAAETLAKKDDPPPGGCMPIGVTVSGEVVFPFQCKEFIERLKAADQKAAAPERKSATAHEGPASGQEPAKEKTVAKQEDSVAPENSKPVDRPVETAPIQKRVELEPHERIIGPPGCTRFRSYDAGSRTYRSYEGRRLSCR